MAIAPARTLGSEKGPGSLSNGVRARVTVSRPVDRLVLSDAGDRDHHVIAGHADDVDGEELVVGWPEYGAGRPGQLAVGWGIDVLNDDLDLIHPAAAVRLTNGARVKDPDALSVVPNVQLVGPSRKLWLPSLTKQWARVVGPGRIVAARPGVAAKPTAPATASTHRARHRNAPAPTLRLLIGAPPAR